MPQRTPYFDPGPHYNEVQTPLGNDVRRVSLRVISYCVDLLPPIRFIYLYVVCLVGVATGLMVPAWYSLVAVQILCLIQILYATRLTFVSPADRRFAFASFAITAVYISSVLDMFGESPLYSWTYRLRHLLHPLNIFGRSSVPFAEWETIFDEIAQFGWALILSLIVYFLVRIFMRKDSARNRGAIVSVTEGQPSDA